MPRGSQTAAGQRKRVFIKLQTKFKDAKGQEYIDPKFIFSRKEGNEIVVDGQPETEFSGYLLKVGHSSYMWEGDEIHTIQIVLVDNECEYKLDMSQDSNLARGLMNKFLSDPEKLGFILIRTYAKPDKEDSSKKFPQIYIENNGEALGWKYNYEPKDGDTRPALKPMVQWFPDPKKPEKQVANYSKINMLFFDDWKRLEVQVKENAEKMGLVIKNSIPPPPVAANPVKAGAARQEDEKSEDGPKDDPDFDPGDEPHIEDKEGDDLPF